MRKLFLPLSIAVCIICCGCSNKNTECSRQIFAMDTVMDIKVYSDKQTGKSSLDMVEKEINRIDCLLDRKNSDSEIYNINKKKSANISMEIFEIINSALSVSKRTDGAFDITIAPVMDAWGFYDSEFRVPSESELEEALCGVGFEEIQLNRIQRNIDDDELQDISDDVKKDDISADKGGIENLKITMPRNACIDLGGIGKGYASDKVVEVLKNNGIDSSIISLGGNVYALGKRKNGEQWNIGITNPYNKEKIIGTLQLSNKCVITSGGYQRYFESGGVIYHHIINPKTGKSADSGLASVTVIADKGITADGLSTALFVMGLEKSIELWESSTDFEAVIVDVVGNIYITEGIEDTFHSTEKYEVIHRKKM